MQIAIDTEYITAKELLRGSGIGLVDAARLMLEATELCGKNISLIRNGLHMAAKEIKRRVKTVSFDAAFNECLEAKSHRRPRTLSDIRYLMNRLIKSNPGWGGRSLRNITPHDCKEAINAAFGSNRQRFKARVVLSGVFSVGMKRGWCSCNPVKNVDVPYIKEREIQALSLEEVGDLLDSCKNNYNKSCSAAVGFMLFAGIRPKEIERLTWRDVDLKEKIISIYPEHSKTGGIRHVSIQPVLLKWLKENIPASPSIPGKICPENWLAKWSVIRQKAGWSKASGKPWQQDCLRHTFASYHAKYFKNFSLLQMEMGHSSSSLLRNRYLNMRGISKKNAILFWSKNRMHSIKDNNEFTFT